MDEKIHNIEERLLFVLLAQHTVFNGQFSIGVGRRICSREFAPSGDKPPPVDCPVELLNVLTRKRLILYFGTGSAAFLIGGQLTEAERRPSSLFLQKNRLEVENIARLSQK